MLLTRTRTILLWNAENCFRVTKLIFPAHYSFLQKARENGNAVTSYADVHNFIKKSSFDNFLIAIYLDNVNICFGYLFIIHKKEREFLCCVFMFLIHYCAKIIKRFNTSHLLL